MRGTGICARLLVCGILVVLGLISLVAAVETQQGDENLCFLDLQGDANALRTQILHGFPDNHLGELPAGKQVFAGRNFVIGDGYLKLGSPMEPRNPRLIEALR